MKGNYTKAKEITPRTKDLVLKRQGNKSITGVSLYHGVNFHHYVPRSGSGVGYEWNIVALTPEEHREFHDHAPIKVNGFKHYTWQQLETLMHNHLIKHYDGWTFDKCIYKKGFEEADYGVTNVGSKTIR